MILYHYTDEQGKDGILRDRYFRSSTRASNPVDARHGEGVYLTKLDPMDHSWEDVARNNFAKASSRYRNRCTWVFTVLPPDKVRSEKDPANLSRDIWRFPDADLWLDNCNGKLSHQLIQQQDGSYTYAPVPPT